MSNLPEQFPREPEDGAPRTEISSDELPVEAPVIEPPSTEFPGLIEAPPASLSYLETGPEAPLFQRFALPDLSAQERIPNVGHRVLF